MIYFERYKVYVEIAWEHSPCELAFYFFIIFFFQFENLNFRRKPLIWTCEKSTF